MSDLNNHSAVPIPSSLVPGAFFKRHGKPCHYIRLGTIIKSNGFTGNRIVATGFTPGAIGTSTTISIHEVALTISSGAWEPWEPFAEADALEAQAREEYGFVPAGVLDRVHALRMAARTILAGVDSAEGARDRILLKRAQRLAA